MTHWYHVRYALLYLCNCCTRAQSKTLELPMMIRTTLFAYATPLFPSAQVWCGDRYLEAVRTMLREHISEFDDSQHDDIQLQILG